MTKEIHGKLHIEIEKWNEKRMKDNVVIQMTIAHTLALCIPQAFFFWSNVFHKLEASIYAQVCVSP